MPIGFRISPVTQRVEPALAAIAGVHRHGAAGDALAAEGRGPLGITASEVADAARTVLNAAMHA